MIVIIIIIIIIIITIIIVAITVTPRLRWCHKSLQFAKHLGFEWMIIAIIIIIIITIIMLTKVVLIIIIHFIENQSVNTKIIISKNILFH